MQGTIEVGRLWRHKQRLDKQAERHALYWYDRAVSEAEREDVKALFGEVLKRALNKRHQRQTAY